MRVEYKYIITRERYNQIRDYFDFTLIKDIFSINGPYPVSSVYYDTPDLTFYYDKVNGEFEHKKARLRSYGPTPFSGVTFFEIKSKANEDQIKKRLQIKEKMDLAKVPHYVLSKDLEFVNLLPYGGLVPVSHVTYDREAYFLGQGENTIRLNFDQNICISEVYERNRTENSVFPEGEVVMEVKTPYRGYLGDLEIFLSQAGAIRTTFSKYATGINLISKLNGMEAVNEL